MQSVEVPWIHTPTFSSNSQAFFPKPTVSHFYPVVQHTQLKDTSDKNCNAIFTLMLASFSKKGFKPARFIRAFSKQPEIPTKYSVMTIPSLRDNYGSDLARAWCVGYLISTASNNCLVIDPTNPKFVVDAVSLSKCNLKGILVTHHHL